MLLVLLGENYQTSQLTGRAYEDSDYIVFGHAILHVYMYHQDLSVYINPYCSCLLLASADLYMYMCVYRCIFAVRNRFDSRHSKLSASCL